MSYLIESQQQPRAHMSLCVQAMAEDLGDQDKAKQIQDQLNELEERAEALDRQRTKNISAIRCVSDPVLVRTWPWPACSLVHSVLHRPHRSLGCRGAKLPHPSHSPLTDDASFFVATSTSGIGSGTLWSLRRLWW